MGGLKIPIFIVLTFFHYNLCNEYLIGKTASGFFGYGDVNDDNKIGPEDLKKIHNKAWTHEWDTIFKRMPTAVQTTGVVTLEQFMKLENAKINLRGTDRGMREKDIIYYYIY